MSPKFFRRKKRKLLILLGLFCITLSGLAIWSQLNFNPVEASSENTPSESIQPTSTPTPPKPAGTSLNAYSTKNGLILRWKKVIKNNSGYEIQYATNKNFKSKKSAWVKNNTKVSKTIKNLKKNTKYYVRIRTYYQTAQEKIYSNFSKIVSMTTADNVTFLHKEGFYCEKISNATQKRMTGKSYTKNNYIQLSDLRYIRIQHYDYNGKIQSGELVVNKKIANNTVKVFYELFQKKYPIQRMKLIDDYKADDEASMKANNTSAFNFRNVSGSSRLSKHAYGLAIDINPKINPYVKGSKVLPSNSKVYTQRDVSKCKGKYKDNMIHKNDVAYKIFIKYGFQWGGNWNSLKDYQHFEAK